MGGPSGGPTLGSVTLTNRGWVAGFGDQLVGTYASEELAQRCLDILRLKSGQDAGLAPDAVELALPLAVSGALLVSWMAVAAVWQRGGTFGTGPEVPAIGRCLICGCPAASHSVALACAWGHYRTTWTGRPPQSCAAST